MSQQGRKRLKLTIKGVVQGVGFRPFVYRLAEELSLTGWVNNTASGVFIEVEGSHENLDTFLTRIQREKPPSAMILSIESSYLEPVGYASFEIVASSSGEKTTLVLPDLSTCSDCLREIFDSTNRRYRYPFTNCTNCGPRYSIIQGLPYDRPLTTMQQFTMCEACMVEYKNPKDRRFHAQPNACPNCGPELFCTNLQGEITSLREEALLMTTTAIRQGLIAAVKGLGGFHLIVDARNQEAVVKLRDRKHRQEKPFALMYPSLELIKQDCFVSTEEEQLFCSPASPIVLLKSRPNRNIAPAVSPKNPYLGIMLPPTPLHHLLMADLGFPVVATSGNVSDEPLCIDNTEAIERLANIADLFLMHNRPIARPVDDSIARVIKGKEMILRRARGYAPLPFQLQDNGVSNQKILAVGAHLKNTIAIAHHNQAFISQHIGDLETASAFAHFKKILTLLENIYEFEPEIIVCDTHPDYISTQYAHQLSSAKTIPIISIQHHYAHVLSCMADNQLTQPVLGVALDGSGYGLDGTVWGGEFLLVAENSFSRVAHWRTFSLPGGEKAVKEPRRSAIGLLYEVYQGDKSKIVEVLSELGLLSFSVSEINFLLSMIQKKINSPYTSSVGRLFDAIAALLNITQVANFEGQGAMSLEFSLSEIETFDTYDLEIIPGEPIQINWLPMVENILTDIQHKKPIQLISACFHNTLAAAIVNIAEIVGIPNIVLTGGCFQNKYLLEQTINRLTHKGFAPHWHHQIPTNDGGISLGQVIGVRLQLVKKN